MTRDEHFHELYGTYYQSVVRFFIRMGFTPDESREFAQDTFARVYEHMDGVQAGALVAYLWTTARNIGINAIRDRRAGKREGKNVSIDDAGEVPSRGRLPDAVVIRRETQERIRQAITRLPPASQQALTLWIEGRTYAEIATILGMTLNAVRSRIRDAKKRLRELLGDDVPLPSGRESEDDERQ